jgi:hypothetical protein
MSEAGAGGSIPPTPAEKISTVRTPEARDRAAGEISADRRARGLGAGDAHGIPKPWCPSRVRVCPWANANIIVCVSIESLEGLETVEATAAEEVIAMIAYGHSDLSARLGENPRYTKCGMIADGPRIFCGGRWILEKDGCKPDFEEFERESGHSASGVLYQGHEAHRLDRMRADRDGAR